MSNFATITGNLGQDPELRFIPSGKAVCTVSVGDTPRKFNRDTNAWEDAGETLCEFGEVGRTEGRVNERGRLPGRARGRVEKLADAIAHGRDCRHYRHAEASRERLGGDVQAVPARLVHVVQRENERPTEPRGL